LLPIEATEDRTGHGFGNQWYGSGISNRIRNKTSRIKNTGFEGLALDPNGNMSNFGSPDRYRKFISKTSCSLLALFKTILKDAPFFLLGPGHNPMAHTTAIAGNAAAQEDRALREPPPRL
jgi:hypothetical protein